MNLLAGIPFINKAKAPRQVISTNWSDRKAILEEDVNLFCWKRPVNQDITTYLQKILETKKKQISFFTMIDQVEQELIQHRSSWDAKFDSAGDAFWQDIIQLSKDYLTFSDTASGTITLKVIEDDACTKFHMDGYSFRLFTTYIGAGTEWLPEKATNRKGLGKQNELIVKDPSQVQQMDTFEVGILKGEVPNEVPSVKGIVHRSPEISQSGEKRIILRVDI